MTYREGNMDVGEYIRKKEREKKNRKEQPAPDLGRYTSMSEEQLMQELFRTANASGVSNEELDTFYRNAAPYLTPEQREKMKNLIMQLKR